MHGMAIFRNIKPNLSALIYKSSHSYNIIIILVAVDDRVSHGKAQARAIRRLAEVTDDLLVTLLHVFTNNIAEASVQQIETARKAQHPISQAGVDVTLDEASGESGVKILKNVEEEFSDQVCVSDHERSPTNKSLFTSATQCVIMG